MDKIQRITMCVNCVALAMCINRTTTAIGKTCPIFSDLLDDSGHDLKLYEEKELYFMGLERTIRVRRGITINETGTGERQYTQTYILDEE